MAEKKYIGGSKEYEKKYKDTLELVSSKDDSAEFVLGLQGDDDWLKQLRKQKKKK